MNSENDTLIILTPGFPKDEEDSTCLPMQQDFVKTLKKNYPKLNIIILSFQYPYYKQTYQWFGTAVISFNGQNNGGLTRLLLRQELNACLKKINNSHKITGLLSFWFGECALVGNRFAGKHGLKHYCWILGQDAAKENKYPGRIGAKADSLIALSDFLQDEFEKNHAVRPKYLIPPGIDTEKICTSPKQKNIDILGVGSLIPLKRYDVFLEVIAEIKKELPCVKAMLIGDGPEKEKLRSLIFGYGLQDHVLLAGELAHEEVLQLMQGARLLLHPSSYEGFSGVCLEALSGGAQVISFCRAMKQEIRNWHLVQSKEEMGQKALDILQHNGMPYSPAPPFLMSDTVNAFAGLFNFFQPHSLA